MYEYFLRQAALGVAMVTFFLNSFLLQAAILWKTCLASDSFFRVNSHLGDSGINLKCKIIVFANEKNAGDQKKQQNIKTTLKY